MRIFIVVLALLAGCATTAGYEKVLGSWVGQSSDHLISVWGAPSYTTPISSGGRVLEYSKQRNVQIGGFTTNTPITTQSNGMVTGDVNATYIGTATTYVPTTTPIQNIAMSCVTRFTVNAQGTITNWAWQGNDCKAKAPDEPKQADSDNVKNKVAEIGLKMKDIDAKAKAICVNPEYGPLLLKTTCNPSELTLAHLADDTKISPEQKPLLLKYRTEVDANTNERNAILRNDGFALDRQWVDYIDSIQPDIEKYNLDLYKGIISWGDYNQLRKNLTAKLMAKRKEIFPQSK